MDSDKDSRFIPVNDTCNMLEMTLSFPEQLEEAYQIAEKQELIKINHRPSSIATIGMGGSGICGNIVATSAIENIKMPVFSFRDYTVPEYIDDKCLVFAISYSGNTIETLTSLKALLDRSLRNIITISSGGILEQVSQKFNLPHIKIPAGRPPRASLGYLLIPIIVSLGKLGLFNLYEDTIKEVIKEVEALRTDVNADIPVENNIAKDVAIQIKGKLPIVYGTGEAMGVVAERWAGQFQENAKVLTFNRTFPELCHNQAIGWEDASGITDKCVVISLEGEWEKGAKVEQRGALLDIVKGKGIPVLHINITGDGGLPAIIRAIYLGDFISIYLSALNNVDPCSIGGINSVKERIAPYIDKLNLLS